MAALVTLAACGRAPADTPPPQTSAPAATAAAASSGTGVPHGDHNPHHGGVVMMKGDLHYEVVLDPAGRAYRVYFTDAVREELPASAATDVVLTIRRKSQPEEPIAMQIDDAGESWIGHGRPISDPATTTARLAFSIQHEPYWIDLPFSLPDAVGRQPSSLAPGRTRD
jgi:hypothetical protein